MSKELAAYKRAIVAAKDRFVSISGRNPDLQMDWEREAGFAMQRVEANEALQRCPGTSIRDAVVNVASVGLSLNPALKHAYLVPRDGMCTLDISYMGLCHLAELSGAIRYVRADVVRQGDQFIWKGLDEKPEHIVTDPFAAEERPIVGVYCYARTSDGGYLSGKMTKAEIDQIRNTSKAPNSPAWKNWYGEMAKKSLIKREQKLWPKAARALVSEAVKVLNESEGLAELSDNPPVHYAAPKRKSEEPEDPPEQEDDRPIEGEYEEVTEEEEKPNSEFMHEATQKIIERKVNAKGLKVESLFKMMGVDGWAAMKQTDAAKCMQWIDEVSK